MDILIIFLKQTLKVTFTRYNDSCTFYITGETSDLLMLNQQIVKDSKGTVYNKLPSWYTFKRASYKTYNEKDKNIMIEILEKWPKTLIIKGLRVQGAK